MCLQLFCLSHPSHPARTDAAALIDAMLATRCCDVNDAEAFESVSHPKKAAGAHFSKIPSDRSTCQARQALLLVGDELPSRIVVDKLFGAVPRRANYPIPTRGNYLLDKQSSRMGAVDVQSAPERYLAVANIVHAVSTVDDVLIDWVASSLLLNLNMRCSTMPDEAIFYQLAIVRVRLASLLYPCSFNVHQPHTAAPASSFSCLLSRRLMSSCIEVAWESSSSLLPASKRPPTLVIKTRVGGRPPASA